MWRFMTWAKSNRLLSLNRIKGRYDRKDDRNSWSSYETITVIKNVQWGIKYDWLIRFSISNR